MGDSLNGGTPISHPKIIIFSRKTPWLLGTTILGNPHIIKAIYLSYSCFLVFRVGSIKSFDLACFGAWVT